MVRKHSSNVGLPGPSGEFGRLAVLFVLAVGVTVAAVFAYRASNEKAPDRVIPVAGPDDERDPVEMTSPITPWVPPLETLSALDDTTARGRLDPDRPEILGPLGGAVAARPHFAFRHDPTFASVGGYERIPAAELAKPERASALRGRPVEVVGTVVSANDWRSSIALGLPASLFPNDVLLLEGTLRADDGQEVRFLEIRTDGKTRPLPVNGYYKVMGVFYRLTEDVSGTIRPFILARAVSEALRIPLVEEIPEGLGEDLAETERDDLGKAPQHDPAFYTLVGYVHAHRQELADGEPPLVLRGREPRDDTDAFRFKRVRAVGRLIYMRWERFEFADMRKEDAVTLGYWHAIVADDNPDQNVPVSVLLPFRELPEELEKWVWMSHPERLVNPMQVEMDGIFFRAHAYEAIGDRRRPRETHLPMIVGYGPITMKGTTRGPGVDVNPFLWWFIAVGVAIVGALVVLLARDRKRSRALEASLRESRVQRRKSQGMDLNREASSAKLPRP